MFTHLRTHSCYSFLNGLPSPAELAQAAVDNGMPALALTDSHSLTGAIEFYQACLAAGVRPVLGLELGVSPPHDLSSGLPIQEARNSAPDTLALLAMDLSGWTAQPPVQRPAAVPQHTRNTGHTRCPSSAWRMKRPVSCA
jgi:DNA polymerase III alpha subunit